MTAPPKRQKLADMSFDSMCIAAQTNATVRRSVMTHIPKQHTLPHAALASLLNELRKQPKTYEDAIDIASLLLNHADCGEALRRSYNTRYQHTIVFFDELVKTCAHGGMMPQLLAHINIVLMMPMVQALSTLTFRFVDLRSITAAQVLVDHGKTLRFRLTNDVEEKVNAIHVERWAPVLCASLERFVVVDFPEPKHRHSVFWPIPDSSYEASTRKLTGIGAKGYVLYHLCLHLSEPKLTRLLMAHTHLTPTVIEEKTQLQKLVKRLREHETLVIAQHQAVKAISEAHALSHTVSTAGTGFNIAGKCVATLRTALASFALHRKSCLEHVSEVAAFHQTLSRAAHATGLATVIVMQSWLILLKQETWPPYILLELMHLCGTMCFQWLDHNQQLAMVQKTTNSIVSIIQQRAVVRRVNQ